jgi:hypothetical protein
MAGRTAPWRTRRTSGSGSTSRRLRRRARQRRGPPLRRPGPVGRIHITMANTPAGLRRRVLGEARLGLTDRLAGLAMERRGAACTTGVPTAGHCRRPRGCRRPARADMDVPDSYLAHRRPPGCDASAARAGRAAVVVASLRGTVPGGMTVSAAPPVSGRCVSGLRVAGPGPRTPGEAGTYPAQERSRAAAGKSRRPDPECSEWVDNRPAELAVAPGSVRALVFVGARVVQRRVELEVGRVM